MRCGWATVHPVEIVISRCRIHFWEGVPIPHCTAFWKCCIWHNPNAGDIGLLIYSSHFSHQPGKLSERRNFVRLGIHVTQVTGKSWNDSLDLIGSHWSTSADSELCQVGGGEAFSLFCWPACMGTWCCIRVMLACYDSAAAFVFLYCPIN